MRPSLFSLLALVSSLATAAPVPDAQAASHIGQSVTLDCRVAEVKDSRKAQFADCGAPYPNQTAHIVKFLDSGARVDLHQYEGRHLLVHGVLRDYRGKPEIVLDSASQIEGARQ